MLYHEQSEDYRPLFWVSGYPVYVNTLFVVLHIAAFVVVVWWTVVVGLLVFVSCGCAVAGTASARMPSASNGKENRNFIE